VNYGCLSSKKLHIQQLSFVTIDEETGMTGAMGLEGGVLEGEILLIELKEDDK
jgi:dipeptidase D